MHVCDLEGLKFCALLCLNLPGQKGMRSGVQRETRSRVEHCRDQCYHLHLHQGIMANSRKGFVASRGSSFL